jgi:hypothetical protein
MNFLESRRKYWINELKRVDLFLLNDANKLRSLDDVLDEIEKRDYKNLLDEYLYDHVIDVLKVIYK